MEMERARLAALPWLGSLAILDSDVAFILVMTVMVQGSPRSHA